MCSTALNRLAIGSPRLSGSKEILRRPIAGIYAQPTLVGRDKLRAPTRLGREWDREQARAPRQGRQADPPGLILSENVGLHASHEALADDASDRAYAIRYFVQCRL